MPSESEQVAEIWRRAMDANVRYYRAVGELTIGHVRALTAAAGDLLRPPATPRPPLELPRAEPKPEETHPQAAMVLESDVGVAAIGAFVVANGLNRRVSAPIVASPLVSTEGQEARPALAFEPEVVLLEPGEQVLVRIAAAVDESLEPGVGYHGELTIPDLPGTRVPIVLRRRQAPVARPAARKSRSKRRAPTRDHSS
jgi:hypothetical protein